MAKVKIIKDFLSGEHYFRESLTGRSFRLIAGSMVWPAGDLDGSIVILGELRSPENRLGINRHPVYKLEEYHDFSVSELLDKLILLTLDWRIDRWITPLCDRRAYLLDDLNDKMRSLRLPKIRYGDPWGWNGKGEGLLPFYHALAQRRTMDEKTLFLGDSKCADALSRLEHKDSAKSILEFPPVAALCFALAEIDLCPAGNEKGKIYIGDGPADGIGGY